MKTDSSHTSTGNPQMNLVAAGMTPEPRQKKEEVSLVIPLIPPSVNRVWRRKKGGGYFINPQAKVFYDAVVIFSRGQMCEAKEYKVHVKVFLGKGQKGDVDNFAKVTLDSLVKSGVIESDAKVRYVAIWKGRDEVDPRTEIRVSAAEGEAAWHGKRR